MTKGLQTHVLPAGDVSLLVSIQVQLLITFPNFLQLLGKCHALVNP